MEPIASVRIVRLSKDGGRLAIQVDVGRPRIDERGSWACPVRLLGLDDKVREIHGEDSMQALCLGIQFIRTTLQAELESGSRLLHSGDEDDDVDFPLDAYF